MLIQLLTVSHFIYNDIAIKLFFQEKVVLNNKRFKKKPAGRWLCSKKWLPCMRAKYGGKGYVLPVQEQNL